MKADWLYNWVVFSHFNDGSSERVYKLLSDEGIVPTQWSLYSTTREIVRAMGLDPSTSHIFHGSKYIGTEKDLPTAIYTLKRMYGDA